MAHNLSGKQVLFITSNTGVERDELVKPFEQLQQWGAKVTHAAIAAGEVQTFVNDTEKDKVVTATAAIKDMKPNDYDLLVIPGGTINADKIRTDMAAGSLVQAFTKAHKPIAAICHAPWLLINADLVRGKHLTSYYTLQIDLENAGVAAWQDKAVVRCEMNNWVLLTSRNPNDIPAFNETIAKEIAD